MNAAAPPVAAARLDRPPPASARAFFPESFGRRYLILVDTEEEFDWDRPFRRDTIATNAIAALPGLHGRLRAAGAAPAYLVDWPVVNDPRAVDVLGDLCAGGATIGAQLHPWVNPPFEEALSRHNSFAGNLPEPLERAKLAALTKAIEAAFGRRPTTYRAGRYGVGPATARLLVELGYRLDSSVRSHFAYEEEGGPSFDRFPTAPYWAGPDARLLEMPLGTGFTGLLRAIGPRLHAAGRRAPLLRPLLARLRLATRIGFTPEGFPAEDACAAIRFALDEGVRILSFSFHSTSAEPGHTPYVRDAADLARFHRWWDMVFDLLAREGVTAATPDELTEAAWTERKDRAAQGRIAPAGHALPLAGEDEWRARQGSNLRPQA